LANDDSRVILLSTGWPKNGTILYALTSSNINRFPKLFHCLVFICCF